MEEIWIWDSVANPLNEIDLFGAGAPSENSQAGAWELDYAFGTMSILSFRLIMQSMRLRNLTFLDGGKKFLDVSFHSSEGMSVAEY